MADCVRSCVPGRHKYQYPEINSQEEFAQLIARIMATRRGVPLSEIGPFIGMMKLEQLFFETRQSRRCKAFRPDEGKDYYDRELKYDRKKRRR